MYQETRISLAGVQYEYTLEKFKDIFILNSGLIKMLYVVCQTTWHRMFGSDHDLNEVLSWNSTGQTKENHGKA
jgi:hypothetical protein